MPRNMHTSGVECSPRKGFRAIIVGGGVTGLIASHCFSKAGIDHVVLERGPEAAPALGASIAIYAHGARILQQLGLLDKVNAISDQMKDGATDRWPDGKPYSSSDIWRFIEENHGYGLTFSERRAFLQVLYDALPDKSRIMFNKRIVHMTEDAEGVEVEISDGSRQKGDIIVGCDGVHSIVRTTMWQRMSSMQPDLINEKERSSIQAKWQCLLGFGPGESGVKNEVSVVHQKGSSLMLISPPDQVFFYVFVKIDRPYTPNKRPRYTMEDAEALAKRFEKTPVSEGVTFGQLWKKRFRGQLVDTEQGMLEHWHYGRTVLAGDSVHKMTPNMALGGNAGIESIAVLTNELRKLLAKCADQRPSQAAITECFQRYEDARKPRLRQTLELADTTTRGHAWDSHMLKFLSIWVFPYLPERTLANEVGKLICKGPKLDFVPLGSWPKGLVAWADEDQDSVEDQGLEIKKSNVGSPTPVGSTETPIAAIRSWQGVVIGMMAIGLVSCALYLTAFG